MQAVVRIALCKKHGLRNRTLYLAEVGFQKQKSCAFVRH